MSFGGRGYSAGEAWQMRGVRSGKMGWVGLVGKRRGQVVGPWREEDRSGVEEQKGRRVEEGSFTHGGDDNDEAYVICDVT